MKSSKLAALIIKSLKNYSCAWAAKSIRRGNMQFLISQIIKIQSGYTALKMKVSARLRNSWQVTELSFWEGSLLEKGLLWVLKTSVWILCLQLKKDEIWTNLRHMGLLELCCVQPTLLREDRDWLMQAHTRAGAMPHRSLCSKTLHSLLLVFSSFLSH